MIKINLSPIKADEQASVDQILNWENLVFPDSPIDLYSLRPMLQYQLVLLAKQNNEAFGYAIVWQEFLKPNLAHLFTFVIAPEQKGRGLGKAFFKELTNYLRNLNFIELSLSVSPNNLAALKIYKSLPLLSESFEPNWYGKDQARLILRLKL